MSVSKFITVPDLRNPNYVVGAQINKDVVSVQPQARAIFDDIMYNFSMINANLNQLVTCLDEASKNTVYGRNLEGSLKRCINVARNSVDQNRLYRNEFKQLFEFAEIEQKVHQLEQLLGQYK